MRGLRNIISLYNYFDRNKSGAKFLLNSKYLFQASKAFFMLR